MLSTLVILATLGAPGDIYREAYGRYAQAGVSDPVAARHMQFLSLHSVDESQREQLANVAKVVACSLSNRRDLQAQIPVRIAGTPLLQLDLLALGWRQHLGEADDFDAWSQALIAAKYPYHLEPSHEITPERLKAGHGPPLVIDALWFVAAMTTEEYSRDAQYLLLYAPGKPPKTIDDLRKFWGANDDPETIYAFLEGSSKVAAQRHQKRQIETFATSRGRYGWFAITYDTQKLKAETDRLQTLKALQHDGRGDFDASEAIGSIDKGFGLALQWYFLANNAGLRQSEAPADLVYDSKRTYGSIIYNSGSCMGCHTTGLLFPSRDEWKDYHASGAKIYAKSKRDADTADELFGSGSDHLPDEIAAANKQYAAAIYLITGWPPERFSSEFRGAVKRYFSNMDLAQCERELETTLLREALGWNELRGPLRIPVLARFARLAHSAEGDIGGELPRDLFERHFSDLAALVKTRQVDIMHKQ
jgi:hypothetical protein